MLGRVWRNFNLHTLSSDCAESAQSCLTLCAPMDCSPQGSSVHGILQARILEWVSISTSRGCSPRDRACVSYLSALAGGFFTTKRHLGSRYMAGGNNTQCSCSESSLSELPLDPVTLHLDKHPKEWNTDIQINACIKYS